MDNRRSEPTDGQCPVSSALPALPAIDNPKRLGELSQHARVLPVDKRREILAALPETELHKHLAALFQAMGPDYTVAITHGNGEFGKDLTLVKQDSIAMTVVGVVVKRGDIKGQTLGDVDDVAGRVRLVVAHQGGQKLSEIRSQVRQALAHPAEIPTCFARLPVNRVLVVLAGEMSGQARSRLEKEVVGATLEIHDMEWLVRNFTEYYPQVFFQGKVVDYVQSRIDELETKHWLSKTGKTLTECFVEPILIAYDPHSELMTEDVRLVVQRRKISFAELEDEIGRTKRMVLVGDPGAGKSAALSMLSLNLLRRSYASLTRGTGTARVKCP